MDSRKALSSGTMLAFPGIRCVIDTEIGRGSNAIVYRAHDADSYQSGRIHHVMIKELFPLKGGMYRSEDNAVLCDVQEWETLSKHRYNFEASHKATQSLLDAQPCPICSRVNLFKLNNTLYTVQDISGSESRAERSRGNVTDLRIIVSRLMNILEAMKAFHHAGLILLNISPDNILLFSAGNMEMTTLIDCNSYMGECRETLRDALIYSIKPGYTAPEARCGRAGEIAFSADIYSISAVFFQMLTGSPLTPFQMIRCTPPDVSRYRALSGSSESVRAWTVKILRRGLHALSQYRYQTIEEMQEDIHEFYKCIDCTTESVVSR